MSNISTIGERQAYNVELRGAQTGNTCGPLISTINFDLG